LAPKQLDEWADMESDSPCPDNQDLIRPAHCIMSWAGVVKDIKALKRYEWCGHSVMMGIIKRPWQDTDTILSCFGKMRKRAIEKYEQFVEHGVKAGNRAEIENYL